MYSRLDMYLLCSRWWLLLLAWFSYFHPMNWNHSYAPLWLALCGASDSIQGFALANSFVFLIIWEFQRVYFYHTLLKAKVLQQYFAKYNFNHWDIAPASKVRIPLIWQNIAVKLSLKKRRMWLYALWHPRIKKFGMIWS